MSDNNPYQPPKASLQGAGPAQGDWDLVDPQRCEGGRGMAWVTEGFRLFARSPGIWIVNFLIFMAITIALAVIPLVSLIGNIISPILTAGLLFGARELDRQNELKVGHLFEGFNQRAGKLAGLGLLTLLMGILVGVAAVAMMFGVAGAGALAANEMTAEMMILMVLVILALAVPVIMAYWFAPALVMFHDVGLIQALKLSFIACSRNLVPFLLYGVVMTVLCIVAAIPFFLGFVVLSPIMIASMYVSYRDIFTTASQGAVTRQTTSAQAPRPASA